MTLAASYKLAGVKSGCDLFIYFFSGNLTFTRCWRRKWPCLITLAADLEQGEWIRLLLWLVLHYMQCPIHAVAAHEGCNLLYGLAPLSTYSCDKCHTDSKWTKGAV